ncbi:NUDIX domain-containing protein [Polaromonas sp. P5_D5]
MKDFANFVSRTKPVGVLYVDVYPYFKDQDNRIQFLLLKRRADVVMPGKWQAISGKINENERIQDAFIRQVEKKTGQSPIAFEKVDYVNMFFDDYYDTVMVVPAASAEISKRIVLDSTLHDDHIFVTYDELSKYDLFPAQMHVYSLLNTKLSR